MADLTTNFSTANVGTTQTTVFTSSTTNGAIVHSLFLANLLDTSIEVTVRVGTVNIIRNLVIPGKNTLVMDKPITLQNGQTITVQSNTDASVDVFASIVTRS